MKMDVNAKVKEMVTLSWLKTMMQHQGWPVHRRGEAAFANKWPYIK